MFIFGDSVELLKRNSVELMQLGRDLAETNNGIYRIWTFPFGAVNIYNPDDVEKVISGMRFNDKSEIYKILRPWLGEGLLLSKEESSQRFVANLRNVAESPVDITPVVSEFTLHSICGSKWQERRKILTPTFHFNILRQFGQIIEESSQRFVANLRNVAESPVDITPVVSEFTLHSICETAMGTKLSEDIGARSYKSAINDMGYIFYQRFSKVYYFFDFIFNLTPLGKKHEHYLNIVQNFTKKVIHERKEYTDKYGIQINDENNDGDFYVYKKKKTAMLDLLLSAEKEGLIDRAGIQEEVDTFMFEGHDTTASGLTFTFMLLANNKFAQDKIIEELQEIFGDTYRLITMEDLPKMKYLERCIKESLRLYPPVHLNSRNLKEKVTLSNYEIPEGTFCHVHIYDLHRCPDVYENPNEFDPDRFLPENVASRHPYAYIPFSAGPRNCIGQKFAIMEMKIAVAQVLREFQLKPVTTPSDIHLLADIVLRNDGPVEVIFVRRK